jgi:D-alanyl-lipoteichoic acid acyltransferase DltB (MBOAT superfamily)
LYVSFFPRLVVGGPIERPQRLLAAIQRPRRIGAADLEAAVFLFASGWLRKSLGDVLATVADPAFAFQIYLDFSG